MPNKTIIVIPCFNEAKRLNVDAFKTYAPNADGVAFVFVNDGSTDKTLELLENLKAELPDSVHIRNLEKNSGKAEAVRQGILYAFELGADFVGYWDADLATPLRDIDAFQKTLADSSDSMVVMGARVALLGRVIRRSAFRHYVGRVIATFISLILGVAVYDTQCGAKLFRVTDELKGVFYLQFKTNWLFDVEILQRLKSRGVDLAKSVYEYPLDEWIDVTGSKLSLLDFPKVVMDLSRLFISR